MAWLLEYPPYPIRLSRRRTSAPLMRHPYPLLWPASDDKWTSGDGDKLPVATSERSSGVPAEPMPIRHCLPKTPSYPARKPVRCPCDRATLNNQRVTRALPAAARATRSRDVTADSHSAAGWRHISYACLSPLPHRTHRTPWWLVWLVRAWPGSAQCSVLCETLTRRLTACEGVPAGRRPGRLARFSRRSHTALFACLVMFAPVIGMVYR
jgi:hypothetical protein